MKEDKKSPINRSQDLNLKRREVSILEACMLSGGALFTVYMPKFFLTIEPALRTILILAGIYVSYIHYKQAKRK